MKTVLLGALCVLFSALSSLSAWAAERPTALIYSGRGACGLCVAGAVDMAVRAGLLPILVRPAPQRLALRSTLMQTLQESITVDGGDDSIFKSAKVWIQPGGYSVNEAQSMGPRLMQKVRDFVSGGGGYVGFCAGSFISTGLIGTSGFQGLGLVPGKTNYHHQEESEAWQIEPVDTLNHGRRWVYFAGGPRFDVSESALKASGGMVFARALNGDIEEIHTHFGKGKVAVSGFHPEASELWKSGKLLLLDGYKSAAKALLDTTRIGPIALWESSPYFNIDPDGSDYDLALEMIQFATSP